ncbi:hypothetical protein QR680_005512 [Steinernema hermaphroditum]|uniref:Uncharacterized protein n=1 Tax=Steinernema hermaphroditum TaxID=289476 RepID=A0AA39HTD0_9BILA|nr:hypothetical protein QR680_005512 [Steinernema hermaphroditum]
MTFQDNEPEEENQMRSRTPSPTGGSHSSQNMLLSNNGLTFSWSDSPSTSRAQGRRTSRIRQREPARDEPVLGRGSANKQSKTHNSDASPASSSTSHINDQGSVTASQSSSLDSGRDSHSLNASTSGTPLVRVKSPNLPSTNNAKKSHMVNARKIVERMSISRSGPYHQTQQPQSSSSLPRHATQNNMRSNSHLTNFSASHPQVNGESSQWPHASKPGKRYGTIEQINQPPVKKPARNANDQVGSDFDDDMGDGGAVRNLLSTMGSQYNDDEPSADVSENRGPRANSARPFAERPLSASTPKVAVMRAMQDPNATPRSTTRMGVSRAVLSLQRRFEATENRTQPEPTQNAAEPTHPVVHDENDSFYDPDTDGIFQ